MKKLFSKVCTEKHCKIIECLFDFRYTRKNVENVLNSQKNRKLCQRRMYNNVVNSKTIEKLDAKIFLKNNVGVNALQIHKMDFFSKLI